MGAGSARSAAAYDLIDDTDSASDSEVQLSVPSGRAPNAILQFTSELYFVEEDEGEVVIDIMRLGCQKEHVSCQFHTEDMTGRAGDRYVATEGKIALEPGDFQKSIRVPIVCGDQWNVTLEFKVVLTDAVGCTLGNYLHTCRVKVIDCSQFPSEKYPEASQGFQALHNVGNLSLFWEYFKMNLCVRGIGWRTCACIIGDQMQNVYIFYKLWAMAFMLNEMLIDTDDPAEIARRVEVAFLIGLGYILPMGLLHFWALAKVQMDIDGHSLSYLQDAIMTKYLNYNEDSRQHVDMAEIQIAIRENARDMAEGYVAALAILRLCGKLLVMICFLASHNAPAVGMVSIMPLMMLIFCSLRNSSLSDAHELPCELGQRCLSYAGDLARNYRLISNYNARPKVNDAYAQKVSAWRNSMTAPNTVRVNNDYFTLWLGPVFVGVYIMTHTRAVLMHQLGHGSFVTTLSVFTELSADFSEGYRELMKISTQGGTLRGVIVLLNRPTDLLIRKTVNRKRRAGTTAAREVILKAHGGDHPFPTDLIEFECKHMGLSFNGRPVLRDVNVTVPQGSIVAVLGKHGDGRQTFLKLIGHELFPTEGEIFIPTHLRILHVSQEVFILNQTVLQNLTFGCPDVNPELIMITLQRLGATKLMEEVQEDLDHESQSMTDSVDAEDTNDMLCRITCTNEDELCDRPDGSWKERLSYSERAKLHLARAILMNPEVMVLQRPLVHFNQQEQNDVFSLLQEHVRNRGLEHPSDTVAKRRPRTTFLSVENQEQANLADVVWTTHDLSAESSVTSKDMRHNRMRGFSGENSSASSMHLPHHSREYPGLLSLKVPSYPFPLAQLQ